jgi:hypothetical protein
MEKGRKREMEFQERVGSQIGIWEPGKTKNVAKEVSCKIADAGAVAAVQLHIPRASA